MIFKDMCYDEKDSEILAMHEKTEGSFLAGARPARKEILEKNFDYESCKEASKLIDELPFDTTSFGYSISKNYLATLLSKTFKWNMSMKSVDVIFNGVKNNSTLLECESLKQFLIKLPKIIEIQKRFS